MKKILLVLLLLLVIPFGLVACGGENGGGNNSGTQTEKVTVTYNGTSMANQEFEKGASLNKPSDPSKDGFIFGGWYMDSSFSTEASFPIVLNNNTTLYAKFNSYQIAFEEAREKTIGSKIEGFEFDYTFLLFCVA